MSTKTIEQRLERLMLVMEQKHHQQKERLDLLLKEEDEYKKLRKQIDNYIRHDFQEPNISNDFKKAEYDIPKFHGQKEEFINWLSKVEFTYACYAYPIFLIVVQVLFLFLILLRI